MTTKIDLEKLPIDLDWIGNEMPIRIQFTYSNRLIAEVIVQGCKEAARIRAAFFNLKYNRKKPFGGAIECKADISRYFDVPVGSIIR